MYEYIEDWMQRAMKYADKRCRKARRGGKVPFSPTKHKLMGAITVPIQTKV
jgi:hypothetical protein